jgi:ribonuclease HII
VRQINNYQKPSFAEEKELKNLGYRFIAGVDEVGRGALMGPVVAAAVILPLNLRASWRQEVRDSKQLTPSARERLHDAICNQAIATATGIVTHDEIDEIGIAEATRRAMKKAIDKLTTPPEFLLIDYFQLPETDIPQKGIKFGDSLCFSIACASIVAKVFRDRLVANMDNEYPGYNFARHKGYGTREHLACLNRKGPSPVHRRSFLPVKSLLGQEI